MKNNEINVPAYALEALSVLEEQGHEAYLAGGCVRDSLIGRSPQDWDITTSASPVEVTAAFAGYRVIPTGIRHGTVSVIVNGNMLEITTYRVDGEYSDHRRPDSVTFTSSLRDDLSRRDFTVNAFAYHPRRGLVDYFGGASDLENKIIRCVGDPEKRFHEDALRILRGSRFACELGFTIEAHTRTAMENLCGLLDHIAKERISVELGKSVMGSSFTQVFMDMPQPLMQIIPELVPCAGFCQHSIYHIYDVYEHILHSVGNAVPVPAVRLAMLLHDITKPQSFTLDENGEGHFHGHAQSGAKAARDILSRLRFDNATIGLVSTLVEYHDTLIIPQQKHIRRWLNRIGPEALEQLLEVQRADNLSKSPKRAAYKLEKIAMSQAVLKRVLDEAQCFNLRDLAVNGKDLISAGIPEGKTVGGLLTKLLDMVIEEEIENSKSVLLEAAITLNNT